jgi:nucleoside-diphosphate-sugar epimerase
MILLTGGLGFIGSHAARALLDLGEDVVVTRHRTVDMPDFLSAELGRRLFVEPADVADPDALKAIGRRYPIDGVLHLATAALSEPALAADVRTNVSGVLTVVRAAAEWRVRRLALASSIAVYAGVDGANREVAEAITARVPDARLELESGPAASHEGPLDLTRVHEAVGYRPAYDVTRAIDEYITWLRDGRER